MINYKKFSKDYIKLFKNEPSQIAVLSYDLVGLIYYLLLQNNFEVDNKLFSKKNKFKGVSGIFEIDKNEINHLLNFYTVNKKEFKEIF